MMALWEARAAFITLARPSVDYCRSHGIDWRNTEPMCGGVYVAPVVFLSGKRFEFDPDGEVAAACEAMGADGETVVDLVAWPISDPAKIRTAIGAAAVLGENVAANPATYAFGRPLRLFRTPFAWLRAGCDGVAVLNMDRAARWLVDEAPGSVAAEDDAHAREIHEASLRLIQATRIVVPEAA